MNVRMKHSRSIRFLASLLSIMMVFTMVPNIVFAAVKTNDIVSTVTAPDTVAYTVGNGTALHDVGLPATLKATVITPHVEEGGEAIIREEILAVTWEGSYDASVAGDYTLIAKFTDQLALVEGVIMPAVIITVEEATPEQSQKAPTVLSTKAGEEFYIRISPSNSVLTTTDGVNCNNFDIGKKGTENFNFDFSFALSPENTTNRKIIISFPLGFTINDSSWPSEITNSLTSRPVRVTTATANTYTLNVRDNQIITSISGTLSAKQEASYLLKNLIENQVYTFSMDVYDGVDTPTNSKQFTMTPISVTPVYSISQWEDTVKTAADIFQISSEDKDVKATYQGKLEYDDFNGTQNGTRVDIHKTIGHLSDNVTFTIPLPNTLNGTALSDDLFAGNGLVRLYFTPEGSTTATYFRDVSYGDFNKEKQTLSITQSGSTYVNDGMKGREISDMLTQAGTISCVLSYNVFQNRFEVEKTGTLSGVPVAMNTTITYKADKKASVAYQSFDGAQTPTTVEGPQWELKYKNNDSIKLDYVDRWTSYKDKIEWPQGNEMKGRDEVIEKGDRKHAVHSNAVITYEYEEAFSPVNFTLGNTKEKDFSYTITVTKLDASGNVQGTQEYVYEIQDAATLITASDLGLSEYAYVSKVEARNPSFSSWYFTQDYQSGALIFTADYKAKKNTVSGEKVGKDEIPDMYPAIVTIKTKSDQIAEQTFSKKVMLREVLDNLQATLTSYGWNRNSFPVNKHNDPGSYWYASVEVTKNKQTMNYNEDGTAYPMITISGAAVGLCDLVSTTNGVLRGYTDQNGKYIEIKDASKYVATVPMAQHVSIHELAADFTVYDMRKVFEDHGSPYATSITMELTLVNEWTTSTSISKPILLGATNTTPGYLNYDNVVGINGVADLDNTYEISAKIDCNSDSHIDFNHDSAVGKSKKLVLGERETTASFRALDYDFINGTSSNQVMNGTNPQLLASMTFRGLSIGNSWVGREMDYQEFTIDLSESDQDLLALTQGISLTAETYNVGYLREIDVILKYTTKNQTVEKTTDIIRMKGSENLSSLNAVYNDITNLLQGEDDYFTSLKICIPNETAVGFSQWVNTAAPSVALRRADPLPKIYPVSGDAIGYKSDLDNEGDAYDRLEAKANISYQDIFGSTDTSFTATGQTSRLKIPSVQISGLGGRDDGWLFDFEYADAGTGTPQGGSFNTKALVSYRFSEATKAIDPELELKPVLYYQIHKDFIPDVSKIAYGHSFSDIIGIQSSFVPAGTGEGTSRDPDYGYLIVDFTNASKGFKSAQNNASYGSIWFPLNVSYTATVGPSAIPIKAVWFDLPFDRDEKGNNPVAQERKYSVEMINTTDGAPYGEAFGNDQNTDYPAMTTDASKTTATMLRWEYKATKNVTKYTTAGLLTNATAAMPFQSGASVSSKDILEADNSMLFGTSVTYIGPENSETENWISYIPVPTGEFGLKLVGIDTTELSNVLPSTSDSYKIYYTEDLNPSVNGVKHSNGTDPDADTSHYILWNNDPVMLANATMLRIEISKFVRDGRGTVHLKYNLREHKSEVGNKVNTMIANVNYTRNGTWVSERGMESPQLTYTLTDMTLKGNVWSESDYTSLYDPEDGLDKKLSGVTMKLIDPATGKEVVQTGNNKATSDSKGEYTLLMPHDGKWNVSFDLPNDKQLVTQYITTKGQNEHDSNESWFNKQTAVAQIDFTSDYRHNIYTMQTVSAGIADKRKITLTPSDVLMHAGESRTIVADVNVDGNFPTTIIDNVVFDQAEDANVVDITDNSNKTADITTINSGKTTATVSIPDGYYLEDGSLGLLTHTYYITSYVNVKYDGNGATSGTSPEDITAYFPSLNSDDVNAKTDELTVADQGDLERVGYRFLGWTTALSGGATDYRPGDTFAIGSVDTDITLYALWEANSYQVAFDGNGGTGSIPDMNFIYDQAQNLNLNEQADNSFLINRPGYTLLGWNTDQTAASNGTVSYTDGQEVTNLASAHRSKVTLYAVWTEQDAVNITYKSEDTAKGTVSISSEEVRPVTGQPKGSEAVNKNGYTFINWTVGADVEVSIDPAWIPLRNIDGIYEATEYTAHFKQNLYSVTYDTQGGGTIADKTDVKYSDANLLPTTVPTRTDYIFTGWKHETTDVTATTKYSELATDDTVSEITLTAQWMIKKYTVKYDSDGGSNISDKTDVLFADKNLLPEAPSKDGFSFKGWKLKDTYVTADTAYNSLVVDGNVMEIILTAQWTENNYKVKYDTGFHDVIVADKEQVKWNDSNLLPEPPKKDGYGFIGWEMNKKQITATDKYSSLTIEQTEDSFITLVAKWVELTEYSILYNSNGGSMPEDIPSTITGIKYKDNVPTPTPVRDGYVFKGWSYEDTTVKNGSTYNALTNDDTIKQIELVAQWEINKYSVNYMFVSEKNPDGFSVPKSVTIEYYGTTAKPNVTTPDNWTFDGWYLDQECTQTYDFNTPIKEEMTLYGQWIYIAPDMPKPEEPSQPSEPPTPIEPENPGDNGPATGDKTTVNSMLSLMGASIFVMVIAKKRRRKQKD